LKRSKFRNKRPALCLRRAPVVLSRLAVFDAETVWVTSHSVIFWIIRNCPRPPCSRHIMCPYRPVPVCKLAFDHHSHSITIGRARRTNTYALPPMSPPVNVNDETREAWIWDGIAEIKIRSCWAMWGLLHLYSYVSRG